MVYCHDGHFCTHQYNVVGVLDKAGFRKTEEKEEYILKLKLIILSII